MSKILHQLIVVTLLLSVGCIQNKMKTKNPLLEIAWETPYGVAPFSEILPEHFIPAFKKAMILHKSEIKDIYHSIEEPEFDNIIVAFNRSGSLLSRTHLLLQNLSSAVSSKELRAIELEITPIITKHYDDILFDSLLFSRIKGVYEKRSSLSLTSLQTQLLDVTYNSFLKNGALLSREQKDSLSTINSKIALLEVEFENNLLEDTKSFVLSLDANDANAVKGLSASLIEKSIDKSKSVLTFTLDKASMLPFLEQSQNRELREKIFLAYASRGEQKNEFNNTSIIKEVLELRKQKATILGFSSYSEFEIMDKMAKTPANAKALLDELWGYALNTAKKERAELQALASKTSKDHQLSENMTLTASDWNYYAERVRQEKYSLDANLIKEYFTLENTLEGFFILADKLFGIKFKDVTSTTPLYHPDCKVFEVIDTNNTTLGVLYFDFFFRDSKRSGAWMTNFREQSYEGKKRVYPIVSIVCNFPQPTSSAPSLLSIDEVETLFHECGHALHSLFSNVEYETLAGTNTPTDFVEFPSQLMENWAFSSELLKLYAFHYKTKELISDTLISNITNASKFNQGFITTEYLASAILDLELHTQNLDLTLANVLNGSKELISSKIIEIQDDILYNKYGLIKEIFPRYRLGNFSHIFSHGYSSAYYSYIWSAVLDTDAFSFFKESGDLFSKEIAKKLRTEVLSQGYSKNADILYRNFRGKAPSSKGVIFKRGLE